MTKRILIGLFILLMIAVSIIAFNFYKNVKQPINPTSFEAIPQHAALIIKEENFGALVKKLNASNMVWELLVDSTSSAKKLNKQLLFVDSLLAINFKSLIKSSEAMASLHLSGANNYDFVFYFPLPGEGNENVVIQQLKSATKINPSKRSYDGASIYSFPMGEEKWALCLHQGTLAFSKSTVLIEDVVRQLNATESLLTNKAFKKALAASGQSEDGNVFINNVHFSKVMMQFLNKTQKKYSQNIENYAGWTELDLSIKPNSIGLNGFSFADEGKYINLLKNQKAQDIGVYDYVPYNTAFLFQYGLSNVSEFFTQRKNLLKGSNQFFNYQKYLDTQTSEYGIDLEVELLGHIDQEIAFVITESLTEKFYDNKFIIYKVKDREKALIDLKKMTISTNASADTLSFGDYKIGKINLKGLFPKLFGKPFINLTENYYTVLEDHVLFANSPNAISNYLTVLDNEKTLANDENFEQFEENLSGSSNCLIYHNIARSVSLYKTIAAEKYLPIIDEKVAVMRKFEAVAFQMTTEKNNLYYNNLFLKYNPVYKKETGSLWELALDTITSRAPELVENHINGSKEIFAQDDANKIYLISSTGKILWTKQLQEPIVGSVKQIDVYKNNKLQLLFNTSSKLYLLDRNGNNVEQFPIKLPSLASNAVAAMDYDKNRNYRLLIGCQDNKVYNYDVTGALVKGWEYAVGNSPAKGTMWHFAISGKDYIVIPLQNGEVSIVERSGKLRVKLTNMLPIGNEIYLKVGSSLGKSYLITADTNATVVKLFLNDKKEAHKIDNIPSNATFSWLDFNGDKQKDFCFTWNNNMQIVSLEKTTLLEAELETSINGNAVKYNLSESSTGISTTEKIYLYNKDGKLYNGFPLKGSTPFEIADINNDNTKNLVVVSGNMLYMYNLQ